MNLDLSTFSVFFVTLLKILNFIFFIQGLNLSSNGGGQTSRNENNSQQQQSAQVQSSSYITIQEKRSI